MIFFVGAGPGDPDLITVKGRDLIERADTIVYAGSLVSEAHLDLAKETCSFYNSAKMTLDEVMEVLIRDEKDGKLVVRLHTGDPSLYGAIGEQMRELDKKGIDYEIVPGVSSFLAAAAAVKKELTLPGVSQTVIISRLAGRTPVPEDEDLKALASHKSSMAIFLSVQNIEAVVEALIEGYESDQVPVAVVYRASWKDERIVQGILRDISEKVKEAGISRQAMILVGDFLDTDFDYSKLYDENFTTGYRQGAK